MDMSAEIIDIMETPDVATWNKGMQTKGNAAEVVKRCNEAENEQKPLKEKGFEDLNTFQLIKKTWLK